MRSRRAFAVVVATVALVSVACGSAVAQQPAATCEIRMSAPQAFEEGMGAFGTRLADDGQGVILYDRRLVEDDGPGIGSDSKWLQVDKSPVEKIEGQTRIKKVLHLDRSEALEARLCVPRGVEVEVNGSPITKADNARYPEIPTALLRPGDNEVVLSRPEGDGPTIKIALPEDILRNAPDRARRPRRSFRSIDGGKTWQPVKGEYLLRLHLIQYAPRGDLISQAIDLGQTAGGDVLLAPVTVESVAVKADAETPGDTGIGLAVRTGPCPVVDEKLWSDWRQAGAAVPQGHRYLQWKATLTSPSPTLTPVLKAVTVTARIARQPRPAWADKVKVIDVGNQEIRYTSMPFAYEDFKHPRLAELRRKYKLDEVVAGAETEFEKLVKLRNWVAAQWHYKPPTEKYPAWDADEILQLKKGFCVQYAIVYMQCCLSLGYNARFVFGYHSGVVNTGHEVVEVWSNQYNTWVLMDANGNLHYADPETNEPLGMLEVHDRMVREYYGDKMIGWPDPPKAPRGVDTLGTCRRLETQAVRDDPTKSEKPRWPRYAKWGMIRMMPRNNFYSQPYPLPKTQGFTWDWSEYWIWEDRQTPQSYAYRYRNITARRADWEWTPNRVRFDASCGGAPRTIDVQMGTFTPGFETFVVRVDGKEWHPSGRTFAWTLHEGRNRLEMRARNVAGVDGPVSHLELDCRP